MEYKRNTGVYQPALNHENRIKFDNSVILLVENKVLVFHAFLSYLSCDQLPMVLIIRSERIVGKVQKVYRAITSLVILKKDHAQWDFTFPFIVVVYSRGEEQ